VFISSAPPTPPAAPPATASDPTLKPVGIKLADVLRHAIAEAGGTLPPPSL
jgi:hypothetical protein